ncbi:Hypothetical predicted protein [Pelobates cultripes]|uniref:Uncharacterized protein n=1 Tax=Pelobates cultripes TaxID=61616 RepID=A0AAD1TFK8_PELCU|nr:Hypothetical predicted protein [Pelobates cultripes]
MLDIRAFAEWDFLQTFHKVYSTFRLKLEQSSIPTVPRHPTPLQHNLQSLSLRMVKGLPSTAPETQDGAGQKKPSIFRQRALQVRWPTHSSHTRRIWKRQQSGRANPAYRYNPAPDETPGAHTEESTMPQPAIGSRGRLVYARNYRRL